MKKKSVRIAGVSAFWGDTGEGLSQVLENDSVDYLVLDYLAEVTMGLLALSRKKNPEYGYIPDFLSAIKPVLSRIALKGVRVITNAGGLNPEALASKLEEVLKQNDIKLKIAVVAGDDLSSGLDGYLSANAYLGLEPIRRALKMGADIILCSRVVDSALVSGALSYEFEKTDLNFLAQASLAGHILECGTQCTGGNFSDWELVDFSREVGFPIVEFSESGSFLVQKCLNTGGLLSAHTVGEQIVYEIGDPENYILPDLVCDFSKVQLLETHEGILVQGALGKPAPLDYKVSLTRLNGLKCEAYVLIAGKNSKAKALAVSEGILSRVDSILKKLGLEGFHETLVEALGSGAIYGDRAGESAREAREVVLRLVVAHKDPHALKVFSKEIAQAATSMHPGLISLIGGRPSPTPRIAFDSGLIAKELVHETVYLLEEPKKKMSYQNLSLKKFETGQIGGVPPGEPFQASLEEDTLFKLALARSGDKGDHANIGLIARSDQAYEFLKEVLDESRVADYFSSVLDPDSGRVVRYDWPGLRALNFVLYHSLGGGGMNSLRSDSQGKSYAQQILEMPLRIPREILENLEAQ